MPSITSTHTVAVPTGGRSLLVAAACTELAEVELHKKSLTKQQKTDFLDPVWEAPCLVSWLEGYPSSIPDPSLNIYSVPALPKHAKRSAPALHITCKLCRCHGRDSERMHKRPGVWPAKLQLELGSACPRGVSQLHAHLMAPDFTSFLLPEQPQCTQSCQSRSLKEGKTCFIARACACSCAGCLSFCSTTLTR